MTSDLTSMTSITYISIKYILLMWFWPFLTASMVKSDLRFEISDLDYLFILVHIAYISGPFCGLGDDYSLQTA